MTKYVQGKKLQCQEVSFCGCATQSDGHVGSFICQYAQIINKLFHQPLALTFKYTRPQSVNCLYGINIIKLNLEVQRLSLMGRSCLWNGHPFNHTLCSAPHSSHSMSCIRQLKVTYDNSRSLPSIMHLYQNWNESIANNPTWHYFFATCHDIFFRVHISNTLILD